MFKSHREKDGLLWRIEPIIEVLRSEYGISLSPSGYYDFKSRKPSSRVVRDELFKGLITDVWESNYSCWGARKVWRELNRQGKTVARCTVERLMRELGLAGLKRGRRVRTTIAGKHATCASDLVNRNFTASAPNKLWVADFTYVSTWEGWCYAAFVTDVFARRVLGFAVSSKMNEKLVADAFEMAVFNRSAEGRDDFSELIHHNDKGSQYTAGDFCERLAFQGIRASIGSVGDAYDNALAEAINGSYKTELIFNPKKGPWKTLERLQLETARWVKWHNTKNITEYNNWHTPAEIEQMLYTTGEDARKSSCVVEA